LKSAPSISKGHSPDGLLSPFLDESLADLLVFFGPDQDIGFASPRINDLWRRNFCRINGVLLLFRQWNRHGDTS